MMKHYLQMLQVAAIYAVLLPVNGMMAHVRTERRCVEWRQQPGLEVCVRWEEVEVEHTHDDDDGDDDDDDDDNGQVNRPITKPDPDDPSVQQNPNLQILQVHPDIRPDLWEREQEREQAPGGKARRAARGRAAGAAKNSCRAGAARGH